MIGTYVFAAVALVLTGAVAGVLAVITLGIRREERAGSLTSDVTDRVTLSARRMNGACTRGLALAREPGRYRQDA